MDDLDLDPARGEAVAYLEQASRIAGGDDGRAGGRDVVELPPQKFAGHFGLDRTPNLGVFVTSFSYRKGLPRDADLVFDVRFLRNPHWDPNLRPSTGQDRQVAAYIEADPECAPFIDRLTGFLAPLLPRYRMEGKSYLTIAIGCTGGRHRSVYIAERLATWLADQGVDVGLSHRALERALDEATAKA